jgi:uncharacterized protein YbaP (TraB family)
MTHAMRGRRWLALAAAALWLLAPPARAQAPAACPPAPQAPSAAQAQAAQREARDHGFLWRITKGGHSSYLFGTLHVGRLAWAFPGPRLREALATADLLAVELDMTDPAVMQTMGAAVAAPSAALEPALRERLQRQVAAACLPEAALSRLHPVMQAITLTLLAGRWEDLDAGYAQEIVLGVQARAKQLPIVSLETAQSQLELLLPRDDAELRRVVAQTLEQLERDRVRPLLRRLAQVWERSELDALERYQEWCECADTDEDRAFLRRLNDSRNAPMVERIAGLHAEGKRLLVAVGALHMTGDNGLPRLLAARGFAVEQLTPHPRSR